jgi:hypothetical protein
LLRFARPLAVPSKSIVNVNLEQQSANGIRPPCFAGRAIVLPSSPFLQISAEQVQSGQKKESRHDPAGNQLEQMAGTKSKWKSNRNDKKKKGTKLKKIMNDS